MFIAALFITAKMQKEPKCPSANTWITKYDIYPYNTISFVSQKE